MYSSYRCLVGFVFDRTGSYALIYAIDGVLLLAVTIALAIYLILTSKRQSRA